jgi:hypothetical protein
MTDRISTVEGLEGQCADSRGILHFKVRQLQVNVPLSFATEAAHASSRIENT